MCRSHRSRKLSEGPDGWSLDTLFTGAVGCCSRRAGGVSGGGSCMDLRGRQEPATTPCCQGCSQTQPPPLREPTSPVDQIIKSQASIFQFKLILRGSLSRHPLVRSGGEAGASLGCSLAKGVKIWILIALCADHAWDLSVCSRLFAATTKCLRQLALQREKMCSAFSLRGSHPRLGAPWVWPLLRVVDGHGHTGVISQRHIPGDLGTHLLKFCHLPVAPHWGPHL